MSDLARPIHNIQLVVTEIDDTARLRSLNSFSTTWVHANMMDILIIERLMGGTFRNCFSFDYLYIFSATT